MTLAIPPSPRAGDSHSSAFLVHLLERNLPSMRRGETYRGSPQTGTTSGVLRITIREAWRFGGGDALKFLGHTIDVGCSPARHPWGSSCGYRVTNYWWVLGPGGERLLMLPPSWQSYATRRVWNERFLALLHRGLPDPVVLELGAKP